MMHLFYAAKSAFVTFLADCGKVSFLWGKVAADCRPDLLGELLFNPRALRERHAREIEFQSELGNRWKRGN